MPASAHTGTPTGAVFLSYASQDAEAAKRICEALRGAGIEVWFDQSELRGGDAWDQSIRRQIKECALFMPVISAHTQERSEGYFRLEWHLAEQRTYLMAHDQPFLVPVVVDETGDASARVPERFRERQWTRLPGGETPPAFCERIRKLLSKSDAEPARQSLATIDSTSNPHQVRHSRLWLIPAIAGFIACAALAIWQPWHKSGGPSASVPSVKPLSEARQLVTKAWEQINKTGFGPEELELADGYCKRATELDPTDAEVWAAWSQVDSWYFYRGYDNSVGRREAARSKAAHAIRLTPDSYEARLAQACYLVRTDPTSYYNNISASTFAPEADRLLRLLLKEKPDEPRALVAFGGLQTRFGHVNEARNAYSRLTQNPSFSAIAWNLLANLELNSGSWTEAEASLERSLAIQPYWGNLRTKIEVALYWYGDLNAAKAALDEIPASVAQTDPMVLDSCVVYFWRGEPDKVLSYLQGIPRDWIQGSNYDGPTAALIAGAHNAAGRKDAERVECQIALNLVEHRLIDEPTSVNLLDWKGYLLGELGQFAEAEKCLQLAADMSGGILDSKSLEFVKLDEGQLDAAMDILEKELAPKWGLTASALRLDPTYNPLRNGSVSISVCGSVMV